MKTKPPLITLILLCFTFNTIGLLPLANAGTFQEGESLLFLPKPGVRVHLSPPYQPPVLYGIKVDLKNPIHFEFILSAGDDLASNKDKQTQDEITAEANKLIRYFLTSLTVPESDLWVNLSPYEKERVIPESFSQTLMGRDLLAQDYLLKQITATLMYPNEEIGAKFWKRVYEESAKHLGTTSIPLNTFNKVWIVPGKVIVYENATSGNASIVESKLKIMLDSDYLALDKNAHTAAKKTAQDNEEIGLIKKIINETIIPELTTEVNEGKNFASLRQVYHSLILATWYKRKIKDSFLSKAYADKNKVAGITIANQQDIQLIYEQYLQAFKKGVYNFIKEDEDTITKQPVSHKYFSGGMQLQFGTGIDNAMSIVTEKPKQLPKNPWVVDFNISPFNKKQQDHAMSSDVPLMNNIVPFNQLITALRNHIGRKDSTLYQSIKDRLSKGETPLNPQDEIGNSSSVTVLDTFIKEHFAVPEEALREIITNAYDAMPTTLDAKDKHVAVVLKDQFMQVTDTGKGMSLDTILKKLLIPFEGGKSSDVLSEIRSMLDDARDQKVERIEEFMNHLDISQLDEIEQLALTDIKNKLKKDMTTAELQQINRLITFTGRFGIGFYSLLYFLKTSTDYIEVITSTGKEAYRIKFFFVNNLIQVGIDTLDVNQHPIGTIVRLNSQSFDQYQAKRIVEQYLSFNTQAVIDLTTNQQTNKIINKEVFDNQLYKKISSPKNVEVFYAAQSNTTGKSLVHVNVHGVTIMTKEIEGYHLPAVVVFNFPANLGLPISRNKILVNELFIEKAKDMIDLIAANPSLLSAFYPLIQPFESNAKAVFKGELLKEISKKTYDQWKLQGGIYLPNSIEFTSIKDPNVFLVNAELLEHVQDLGTINYYDLYWQDITNQVNSLSKGNEKKVYAIDFSDETKLVITPEAILINRRHIPTNDTERALFNVLLRLKIKYVGSNAQEKDIKTSDDASNDTAVKPVPVDVTDIVKNLPDRKSLAIFKKIQKQINLHRSYQQSSLMEYLTDKTFFLEAYQAITLLINPADLEFDIFVYKINFFLQYRRVLRDFFLDQNLKNMSEYLKQNPTSKSMYSILKLLMDELIRQEVPTNHYKEILKRLYNASDVLNITGQSFFNFETLLMDDQSFNKYLDSIRNHQTEVKQLIELQEQTGNNYKFTNELIVNQGKDLGKIITTYQYLVQEILEKQSQVKINDKLDTISFKSALFMLAISLRSATALELKIMVNSLQDLTVEDIKTLGFAWAGYYLPALYGKENWKNKYKEFKSFLQTTPFQDILLSSMNLIQKTDLINELIHNERSNQSIYSNSSILSERFIDTVTSKKHFLDFMLSFDFFNQRILSQKFIKEHPQQQAPPFIEYKYLYHDEIVRKIGVIFAQLMQLSSNEFELALQDFFDYSRGKRDITERIKPYIFYLIDSSDINPIGDQQITLNPTRRFSLIELYDTFIGLSDTDQQQEETEGLTKRFELINKRIDSLVNHPISLTDERRRILSNTVKAASRQSVDDLIFLRELVQNVLDETVNQHDRNHIVINTYQQQEQGKDFLVLDIQDEIGMNPERIFNKLLMPFSSSKKDQETYRGSQGQGFFTLLSQSAYVLIRSVRDELVTTLKITPIKKNDQIIDFTIEEMSEKKLPTDHQGTRIQAVMASTFPSFLAEKIMIEGEKFAGLIDQERLLITFNGNQINTNKPIVVSNDTPYGKIKFYSSLGNESFIALGGLYVRTIDDELMEMIPPALRPILLEHGFAIDLPFERIRRIQGGSDIANKLTIFKEIKNEVALGAIKLVMTLFARGDLPSLEFLGYDYYNWTMDWDTFPKAQEINRRTIDISEDYFNTNQQNNLAKLLLSMPLDFLSNIIGRPMSLAEIFHLYTTQRQFFTDEMIRQLPQPIQNALSTIDQKHKKEKETTDLLDKEGLSAIEVAAKNYIPLPSGQGKGMGHYWAFIKLNDEITKIVIKTVLQEHSQEKLGQIYNRMLFLNEHPPQSYYYIKSQGISMAHAQQGGDKISWNLIEQEKYLELFNKYLSRTISKEEFLSAVIEEMFHTLTHELVHLIEESSETTHNKIFFDRQELLVSALIGAKKEVERTISAITSDPTYIKNIGNAPIKELLTYIQRTSLPPTDPAMSTLQKGFKNTDLTHKGGVDLSGDLLQIETNTSTTNRLRGVNSAETVTFNPELLEQFIHADGIIPVDVRIKQIDHYETL